MQSLTAQSRSALNWDAKANGNVQLTLSGEIGKWPQRNIYGKIWQRYDSPVCEKEVFTPGNDDSSEESEDEEGALTDCDSVESADTVKSDNSIFSPRRSGYILSHARRVRRRSNRVAGPIPPPKPRKFIDVTQLFKRIFTIHEVIQKYCWRDPVRASLWMHLDVQNWEFLFTNPLIYLVLRRLITCKQ